MSVTPLRSGNAMHMILCFLATLAIAATNQDAVCSDKGSSIRFIVTSRKNKTNHREVLVNLDQELNSSPEIGDEVTLDISHKNSQCSGREQIYFTSVLTVPEGQSTLHQADYEYFPGVGYYKLHTVGRLWDEALLKCATEGAHLLVLNSESEADVVRQFFARKPQFHNVNDQLYGAYVGLNDVAAEGHFVAVTGELLESTGYTKWAPGEPRFDRGQNYVAVEQNALMHDIANGRRMAFICEQEI